MWACFAYTGIAGVIAAAALSIQAAEPLRNRREFAAAINQVKDGMSADEALRLLGKPDDVMTRDDVGWRGTYSTLEIWRYGTAGHLRPATLGEISINEKHRVEVISGKGTPGPMAGLSESQVRVFVEALADVETVANRQFNPRHLIRAVNLLQPVGKDAALAAIEEFLRVTPLYPVYGGDGPILVMRVLFDVPTEPTVFPEIFPIAVEPGCMPPMWDYSEPANKKGLPRSPIAVEGDIPFLVGFLVPLGGVAPQQQPEKHLAYFRKYGKVRSKKLVPSDKPFAVLDTFIKSPRWPWKRDATHSLEQQMLKNQAILLIDTVSRTYSDCGRLSYSGDPTHLKIRWDEARNVYTFPDGSTLPAPHYRRYWWRPFPNREFEFGVERESPSYISAFVSYANLTGDTYATFLRVLNVKSKQSILVLPVVGGAGLETKLDAGTEIQVEFTPGGKKLLSPIFKP